MPRSYNTRSYNRWPRNTCGCWQNAMHLWMEMSQDIQWCPTFYGTGAIPGPLHARYKHIYNAAFGLCKKRPSIWMDALIRKVFWEHQNTSKAPILKPIDYDNPDPIWVITDGSKAGVGAVYGQGPNWKTCQPAGFMSKKFSNAQQHYRTHEHETIAVLKALMKWEYKLLGCKFTLVTDHKGLEYFETQKNLLDRQVWWWEFLSHFNYTIMHVNGVENKVVDCSNSGSK